MNATPIKICPCCNHVWPTLESFLSDPTLQLAGYQAHFADLTGGFILFTHTSDTCGTSMAVPVKTFVPLSDSPILSQKTQPVDNCPELCMREGCFDPCPEKCECNWVRHILTIIKEWPKTAP